VQPGEKAPRLRSRPRIASHWRTRDAGTIEIMAALSYREYPRSLGSVVFGFHEFFSCMEVGILSGKLRGDFRSGAMTNSRSR